MSWLARIQIDYEAAAHHKLQDSYAWHQAIWRAFPDREDEKRSFLFRIDKRNNGPEAFVLTRVEPVCPDWCPQDGWSVKPVKPEFLGHRFYRFDLRANATRKVKKPTERGESSKNGRRAVISSEHELLAWLDRKAEQGGFRSVDMHPLVIDPRTDFHFRKGKGNGSGLHVGVRFRGALEVTDAKRFSETFYMGIGSAKAFGFGLLLLQPIQTINE